ncbi:unnamed protein product, partial [Meganyctiphanes norvegica]
MKHRKFHQESQNSNVKTIRGAGPAVDNVDDMEHDKNAEDAEVQEREHFKRIVVAFKAYKNNALQRINEKYKYMKTMSDKHQALLKSYKKHLDQQKVCVEHNAEVIKLIIRDVETMFENVQHDDINGENITPSVMASDIDKVQSTLRQLVRDWSSSGEHERQQCYAPIINQIEHLFPDTKSKQIGQINFFINLRSLGNKPSTLTLCGFYGHTSDLTSVIHFDQMNIIECSNGVNSLQVYPWVHSGSNTVKNEDQLRSAFIPDVDPSDLPENSQFTMAAGDFLEVILIQPLSYSKYSIFHLCSVHITFIVFTYEVIHCGYWVNLGPLLYHFSDQLDEKSIEPSYEEVKSIITGIGFNYIVEDMGIQTTYTQDVTSMLKYEYDSVFFVVQKPV